MVFAVSCFAGYFWSTYAVPETAGVSLEEIDAVFGSSAGREDMQLKYQVSLRFSAMQFECILTFEQIEQDLGLLDLVAELTAGPVSLRDVE